MIWSILAEAASDSTWIQVATVAMGVLAMIQVGDRIWRRTKSEPASSDTLMLLNQRVSSLESEVRRLENDMRDLRMRHN